MVHHSLRLYEELLLLALQDKTGKLMGTFPKTGLAAAVLADLMLLERIDLVPPKNRLVDLISSEPTGDPLLDLVLGKIGQAKRRKNIEGWVSKLSKLADLQTLAAQQLVADGVIAVDEKSVLKIFTSVVYPEVNPVPETAILERLEHSIFNDDAYVDDRTVILIALAHPTKLLDHAFTAKAMRNRKRRVKTLIEGVEVGEATKKAIDAINAAVFMTVIVPITS